MRLDRLRLVAAAAVAACGAAAPGALAQEGPPAVWQYVERIPTGGGLRDAGVASADEDVPPPLRDALVRDGGTDFTALLQIVSSPGFGAPRSGFADEVDGEAAAGALSVNARVLALAAALVLLTALVAAARARDR